MYNYNAKIVRWIDGDTVLLDIDLGFFVTRQERIRLARINAPELNSESSYLERKAIHARKVASLFCPEGSIVTVTTEKNKRDMYARYIAEIIYNGKNISDFLIKNGCVEEMNY
jgi:micrococcal nuclease